MKKLNNLSESGFLKLWLRISTASLLIVALTVSLCGCCVCLPSQLTQKKPVTNAPIGTPDATQPVTEAPTEDKIDDPTEDKIDDPTEPTTPQETPEEPPVDKPVDDRVTAYLAKNVYIVTYENDTVSNMTVSPQYDSEYNLWNIESYVDGYLYSRATYNGSLNKPLLWQRYNQDGIREDYQEHVYDEQGNLFYIDQGSDITGDFTVDSYTYNENNQVTSYKVYNGDMLWSESNYYYDDTGLLLYSIENYYNEDSTCRKDYNAFGHVTLEYFDYGYGYTENRIYSHTYVNDVLTKTTGYSDGKVILTVQYDTQGREIFYCNFGGDQEINRIERIYDGDRLVEYIHHYMGEKHQYSKWTYDANGKLTDYYCFDETAGEYHWVYTYGENGQLISIQGYNGSTLYRTFTFEFEAVTVDQATADSLLAVTNYIIENS